MKFKATLFILFSIAVLASCQKEDAATPVKTVAYLRIVNESGGAFNVLQGGNRVNTLNYIYPNGYTSYLSVLAGQQNYEFKNAGSADVAYSTIFTLDSLGGYSLFAAGLNAENIFLANDAYANIDTVAQVRFVNVSTDSIHVDITLSDSTGTVKFENKGFRSVSEFLPTEGGRKALKVFLTGTTTPLSIDTINLQSGNVYTLFSRGKKELTGDAGFSVGLMVIP